MAMLDAMCVCVCEHIKIRWLQLNYYLIVDFCLALTLYISVHFPWHSVNIFPGHIIQTYFGVWDFLRSVSKFDCKKQPTRPTAIGCLPAFSQ